MLDFKEEDLDDGFALYFEKLCITTKMPKKSQMTEANDVCKTYFRTLE